MSTTGMNWAGIRRLFLASVGSTTGAVEEWADHVTQGYRDVCSRISLQELEDGTTVPTVIGQDYVTLPAGVFHVITIHDDTTGVRLNAEASGMRGRSRYLAPATGKPPAGKPRYYAVSDGLVWLRPTPDAIVSLMLRYKIQPAAITDADLGSFPLTSAHLDNAIVFKAAENYHLMHPDTNVPPEGGMAPSDRMAASFQAAMAEPQLPKDRERFDHTGRMYIRGFRLGRR